MPKPDPSYRRGGRSRLAVCGADSPSGLGASAPRTEKRIKAVKRSTVSNRSAETVNPPYTPGLSTWWSSRSLRSRRNRRPRLEVGFTLICLQRLSCPYVSYPALPLARQLEHQRYVPPNPLVLGRKLRKSPTPTTDRDRPVSRRSKPSSRTAFIGEQPNPWELLHPQDAMSRHRTKSTVSRGVDYIIISSSILGIATMI